MNDEQCHVCGSDPGPGPRCTNCGSRLYRYATEDAHDAAISSANIAAELEADVPRANIERQASRTERQSSSVERTDVFSQTEQRSEVRRIEGSVQPTDIFGIDGDSPTSGSPSRSILLRMVLLAILIVGVLATQVPQWREAQQAGLPSSATLPALDPNAPLAAPLTLTAWDELALGDCVLWPAAEADFPIVVDCRASHDAEISGVASLTQVSWPFTEESFDLSDECLGAFSGYVGQTFSLSQWRSGWIAPSLDEWDAGVRNYQCYVYLRETRTDQRAYQSGT